MFSMKEYQEEYYINHRTEKNGKAMQHYWKHHDEILTSNKKRYDEDEEYKKRAKEAHKKYRKEHSDKMKDYVLERRIKALQIVSNSENPKCIYCGCDDFRFLEINHINGGGYKEWKDLRKKGTNLINQIVYHNRPTDDLEIACRPCNAIHYLKMKYGEVPLQVIWGGKILNDKERVT